MTAPAGLLLLLLLGLSQAPPLQEGSREENPDTIEITTQILMTNNGTNEILLEGDMLVPRTRNAMKCYNQNCLWKKGSNGLVTIPYTISTSGSSGSRALMLAFALGQHSRPTASGQQHKQCVSVIYLDPDSLKDCQHYGE